MKCRKGFVSNSSSSSFVLAGRYLGWAEFLAGAYNQDRLLFLGCGDEGLEMWEPESKQVAVAKTWLEAPDRLSAFEMLHWDDSEIVLQRKDLPEEILVMGGESSNNHPSGADELIEDYGPDSERDGW